MKPLIYMAIGALLPIAAYEFMNTKAYRDMLKKVKDMVDCKCEEASRCQSQNQQ